MSDGFQAMVDAAQPFFRGLAANNEKAWFEARKAHYVDDIRKPAELLAELLAEDLSRLTGHAHAPKVFRIYRDVRFSKDKSPYNPHLHVLWSSGEPTTPSWFFAVEPSGLWMGMGLLGLSGEMLTRYRRFIDADGAELKETLAKLEKSHGTKISDYGPEPLKRVPKPFDADHPHGDLLRRKGLALGADLASDWRETGLVAAMGKAAKAHLPLWSLFAERM